MKMRLSAKLVSLLLAAAMLVGFMLPAGAAGTTQTVSFTQVDNSRVTATLLNKQEETKTEQPAYADTDVVRVSIFLEKRSTIDAGFSTEQIAMNDQAMAYRDGLKEQQAEITAAIERKLGEKLDVVWNLTLAANLISANVPYGMLEAIEQIDGVESVLIETRYEPQVVSREETADPNMATSSKQIGSSAAWAAGYTGAGSRVAVIDTGADTDHQSLNAAAFEYSLQKRAEQCGMSAEAYMESLNLLDQDEIAKVAGDLNAAVGKEAYFNTKIPFGYNYIDADLDIIHDNDNQGSHGSHVSGIATANAYIPEGDGFVSALENAMLQGVAPDAQLITMKVFGKDGGAYDSDYMAAIEDAVVLGCDSVNLSLGTPSPGNSRHANETYQTIMENLTKTGIVVVISAGNAGTWVKAAQNGGYLYAEDVSLDTVGAPGSLTNALTVASVDNDGSTGYFVSVGDVTAVYSETGAADGYSNEPFASIAGDHPYIFTDGFATADEIAALGDVLEGKIFLCSRGSLSFYEKANNAVAAGAAGVLIYDNQPGIINMDLTDYSYTKPVAALTQKDGAAIRAASTAVTDDSGNVLYYTGTITVGAKLGASQFESEYYTMSDFSSWGVPGSLQLKPEITAPGGSIYSINGVDTSGKGYEIMSGTSMAAPQISGMTALVAQFVREEKLAEKTGLSERQLLQSLLMSTAVPMEASEGSYYPVIQQGAGLANAMAAVSADSYITMAEGSNAGAADGKVKAELGDDPDRTGRYAVTFTLHNLTDAEKVFDLNADFFVQAIANDGAYNYMDLSTVLISADVSWSGKGVTAQGADVAGRDVNGDGTVNTEDGQAVLDYAAGVTETLANAAAADVDGDGDVDSHDAYLLLKSLSGSTVTVPADGSAEITANITLSDSLKATINSLYANGTYVQGYLFAESRADEEGVAGTCHSIPVLGFFGSWTDPSMFDVGSWPVYATGEETRIPYLGMTRANDFRITYEEEPEYNYSFGGNPVIPDAVYMPERNAINSADAISGVGFVSIRNAAASRVLAVNETTGAVIREMDLGYLPSAYYYDAYGMWQNTGAILEVPMSFADAAEGDVLSVAMTLAPEYYVDENGTVNWDALGDGATHGISMIVDNTAPELKSISLNILDNTMTVVASDNEYVAAVGLYNKSGTRILSAEGAKAEIDKGETAEYTFSLDGINGKKFLVQVVDYAMNKATYLLEMQLGEELPMPEMIAFDMAKVVWAKFDKDFEYNYKTGIPVHADTPYIFYAATIAEHYVFAATSEGDLYVMPEDDLTDMTFVVTVDTLLTDMAYNQLDGNVYAVNEKGKLVTIDKLTGIVTEVGKIGVDTNTLACDGEGTFFCNELGTGTIYSFTLDTLAEPTVLVEDVGIESGNFVQTMEIDPNTGMLFWNSFYKLHGVIGFSYLYEIDPATGEFIQHNDFWHQMTSLLIPLKTGGDDSWTKPTDVVSGISLSRDSVELLRGGSIQLTANVYPWTATDRTVTWSTADPAVATVDKYGMITATSLGTTTVTATSNLDPSFSASCTVTVTALQVTITGTVQDEEGMPMFYSWDMAKNDTWTPGAALEPTITSATYSTGEDVYYIVDSVYNSWDIHKVGTDGKTIQSVENPNAISLWDIAYSEYYTEKRGHECVTSIYYYYLLSPKDPMAMDAVGFNLSNVVSYLTGLTSMGYEQISQDDVIYDTEHLIMLDSDANVWDFWIYDNEKGGMGALYSITPSNLPCEFLGDSNMDNMFTSLFAAEDGSLFLSSFNGETSELFRLIYDAEEDQYLSTRLGDMGEAVWPSTITAVTFHDNASANRVAPAVEGRMEAERISAAELASAEVVNRTGVHTVTEEEIAAKLAMQGETAEPDSSATVDPYCVTVDITAPEAATNGVSTVSWNTDALVLYDIRVNGDYTALVEKDGALTFGYVALNGIEAGDTVATVTFEIREPVNSVVTVSYEQLNNTSAASEQIPVVLQQTELFELAGANMTLGNDLTMNFFVNASDAADGMVARIDFHGETLQIDKADWTRSGTLYKFSFHGIAAKEMVDDITVTVYDANGIPVSKVWTDSVRSYAMRMLDKSSDAALKTALVDMLNYGAASQNFFGYNPNEPANGLLSDAQRALASDAVEARDIRVTAAGYVGSSLELESNIILNFYFNSSFAGKTAVVTYTDHYGKACTKEITAEANGSYAVVSVDTLVFADYGQAVTVEINGITVVDSVESYAARNMDVLLNEYLVKFCHSAWESFH